MTLKLNEKKSILCFFSEGNAEITKLLIEKGADVNAMDSKNRTALMLAALKGA